MASADFYQYCIDISCSSISLQLGPPIEKCIHELDSQHDLNPKCTLPAIHETFTAALNTRHVLTLKTRFQ